MKLLTSYAVTIFLIVVVGYGAFGYVSGTTPYFVVSDRPSSMSPTINYGGVVVIYGAPFSSLKAGDIIVFHDPLGVPQTIVHRIVKVIPNCPSVGNSCLVTKGDNNATNPTADPWNVTQRDYVGQVMLILPYAGYLLPTLWASEGPLAYAPIILVAAAAVILAYVYDAWKAEVKGKTTPAV